MRNSLLDIIKKFFKSIIGKNNKQYLLKLGDNSEDKKERLNQISFKEQMLFDNKEEMRILKLRTEFETGLILEDDLSDDDYIVLTDFYIRLIKETKASINNYKKIIENLNLKVKRNES